jgi:endonuclease YncB( thermonuclease family)
MKNKVTALFILVVLLAGCSGRPATTVTSTSTTTVTATVNKTVTLPQKTVIVPKATTVTVRPPSPVDKSNIVDSVIVGDTIKMKDGKQVRLTGIIAAYEPSQCGWKQATTTLKFLVGKKVTLVRAMPDNVDEFDRLWRYVEYNGTDVGLELIKDGWATADPGPMHYRRAGYLKIQQSVTPHCK